MTAVSVANRSLSARAKTVRENIYNNAKFYKQKIISMLFIYFLVMIFLVSFTGFCSYTKGDGIFVGTLQKWVVDIFGGNVINDVKKLTYIEFDSVINSFSVGGIALTSLGGMIKGIHRIFKNLGYMLLIGYLALSLMDDFSFNQVYIEKMIKKAIFFCVGIVLINKSMELVYAIANIGSAVVGKVSAVAISNMPNYDALCQEIYDNCSSAKKATGTIDWLKSTASDLVNGVGYILQLFIPWIASMIAGVIVKFVCWSRFIEILILAIISPLSFADISKGSSEHSNALRAIKNMIALSLSGAMILLICIICNQIQGALITEADFTTSVWNCVMVALVQMGLVSRANEVIKQGLGMA